jgi:predicted nucleic acid-binding protein
MLYYLDTNIVIYAVEGQPPFQQRARNHVAALENAGHRFVVGELTCTECLVQPLRAGDAALLLDYEQFFSGSHLTTIPLTPRVHRRAAMIRGAYRYRLADAWHLAVAVEQRIDRFLTNDNRLAAFPDIFVEVLP